MAATADQPPAGPGLDDPETQKALAAYRDTARRYLVVGLVVLVVGVVLVVVSPLITVIAVIWSPLPIGAWWVCTTRAKQWTAILAQQPWVAYRADFVPGGATLQGLELQPVNDRRAKPVIRRIAAYKKRTRKLHHVERVWLAGDPQGAAVACIPDTPRELYSFAPYKP